MQPTYASIRCCFQFWIVASVANVEDALASEAELCYRAVHCLLQLKTQWKKADMGKDVFCEWL